MVEPANAQLYTPWIEAIQIVGQHYRLTVSVQQLKLAVIWEKEHDFGYVLRRIANEAGLYSKQLKLIKHSDLNIWRLPLVVQLHNGQVAVVERVNSQENLSLRYSGDQGLLSEITKEKLLQQVKIAFVMRPIRAARDARVDDYIQPYEEGWLRRAILVDWRLYLHLFVASFLINTLGLAGIIFTRQVYDRVIPAESYPTLYVLFTGVLVALVFVFVFRILRAKVVDMMGKRADLRISDKVYGHVLRIRNSERPLSTGSLIAQVRELDNIREILTSTILTAVADVPFFLLFCVVFWFFAGELVWVPAIAVLLMVLPGFLAQPALKKYATQALRERSLSNAILVEAIQGYEDIKTTQSELRFQNQWNNFNSAVAEVSLRLRSLTNWLNSWTSIVQNSVFAVIVMAGTFKVIDGDLSVGSLIAASILGARMLSPMTKLTLVLTRWQQAKIAFASINKILALPLDDTSREDGHIHVPNIQGNYKFKNCNIVYRSEQTVPVLTINNLRIQPGEKIGLLGRNGAGKSTLLQTLSGLLLPVSGEATLENVSLAHIGSIDIRRNVGFLSQNATLFYGTIRDNITMGAPLATEQEIIFSLQMTGALEFVQRLPTGLDYIISEGGRGLSGGQRQALLLCRLILRDPNILLLDEPTSAMDDSTEHHFIQQLAQWARNKTLVVATHKVRVLELVNRVIVMSQGRISLDDNKQFVLEKLRKKGNRIPQRQ